MLESSRYRWWLYHINYRSSIVFCIEDYRYTILWSRLLGRRHVYRESLRSSAINLNSWEHAWPSMKCLCKQFYCTILLEYLCRLVGVYEFSFVGIGKTRLYFLKNPTNLLKFITSFFILIINYRIANWCESGNKCKSNIYIFIFIQFLNV